MNNTDDYDLYLDETSEEKQERMNCGVARGVWEWSCYRDCAFFSENRCTYNDVD